MDQILDQRLKVEIQTCLRKKKLLMPKIFTDNKNDYIQIKISLFNSLVYITNSEYYSFVFIYKKKNNIIY